MEKLYEVTCCYWFTDCGGSMTNEEMIADYPKLAERADRESKLALMLATELAQYDDGEFHSRLNFFEGDWRCIKCSWDGKKLYKQCSECAA